MESLFSPYKLGHITLKNKVVMAPMGRSRGKHGSWTPERDTCDYFAQRAGAGLLITGSLSISVEARGWGREMSIYNHEQVYAWRKVTQAVHEQGGVIFAQLRHIGRATHISHLEGLLHPVSSVSVQAKNSASLFVDENGIRSFRPQSEPRALKLEEIPRVINDFVQAAANAIEAGFDGVEIHAANGYLHDQFINAGLNNRDDIYGGDSMQNRLRFTLETVDAVAKKIGAERVGVRISPFGRYNDMPSFTDEGETYIVLAQELGKKGLAYLHLSDQTTITDDINIPENYTRELRQAYQGTFIIAGGFDSSNSQAAINEDITDLVAIGRPFIANPDLVYRMQNGLPLNTQHPETFYTEGEAGYNDYPFWNQGE
ncbi:alkene reductase [Dickeya dianthicola]|uniref:alkene reductase n=1 Tax=Dickeya dianthicola TaxID=204039 RepID=UPI001868DFA7|nr:alkene reductase [Dickeya dianthicola]QOL13491.1 alkene reductase [Dickeya dianthicola]